MSGDEDRSRAALRRRPLSAAIRASCDVVADLSELESADASLMVDLAVLGQRLRGQGCALRLRGCRPPIQRLVERVGLDRQPAVALDDRA